ncbi:MAG: HAD hydrolase-like protein [Legionellales bacterium]|nr:HAD hydrolase-like protein [Legionellales bacterium]
MTALCVFDVDGTLATTNGADSQIFTTIVKQALDIDAINSNWANYRYSTDSGIIQELFAKYRQRQPSVDELQTIRMRYITALQQTLTQNQQMCQAIAGAQTIFHRIRQLGDWDIALATGAWHESAHLKLSAAQIPHQSLPKAYADDHWQRSVIIQTAIERAQKQYQRASYQRIVYVGDQPWDQQAAQALAIEFVGIGDADFSELIPVMDNYLQPTLINFLTQTMTT